MTDIVDTSELGELAANAVAPKKSLDPIKGYLYLLPGSAKGLIIQNRPDFRITSVLPAAKREIHTNYNRGIHKRELSCPPLMLSQLFLKGPVSPNVYLSGDALAGCNCESCSRKIKAAKKLANDTTSPEFISHHPACGCFYCKLDRVDNHRQFFIFAWDQSHQDKVMAQPYRPSNVYSDGKICFRKDNDRKIQMPLTLREANSTFWGTAFDPDFVQARGAIPHTCLRRQHLYQQHRHLCSRNGGHPHNHSCEEIVKFALLEQSQLNIEISKNETDLNNTTVEGHTNKIEKFNLVSEKNSLLKKQEILKLKVTSFEARQKALAGIQLNNYVDVDSILVNGGATNEENPTTETLPVELALASFQVRLESITALLTEIISKLAEKAKLELTLAQKVKSLSENKEVFFRKHSALDKKVRTAKERCLCCVGGCQCAQKCLCCSQRCDCFKFCPCSCCKSICSCQCACDLSIAFADYVAGYEPKPDKWENFTYYICGEEFYSSSKAATAAFIGFKRDLESHSIPETYYRTTPKFEGDALVVGSAFLNETTGVWTIEFDKDFKLEFPFSQLRMVR